MIELDTNKARGGITSPHHNVLTVLLIALVAVSAGMFIGVVAF
jgi:hypothetical protein